jgi:hypothetical protein
MVRTQRRYNFALQLFSGKVAELHTWMNGVRSPLPTRDNPDNRLMYLHLLQL